MNDISSKSVKYEDNDTDYIITIADSKTGNVVIDKLPFKVFKQYSQSWVLGFTWIVCNIEKLMEMGKEGKKGETHNSLL